MYRIFTGANGYYVAWKRIIDGFHRQPSDDGARIGFDRARAERELEWAQKALGTNVSDDRVDDGDGLL